MSTIAQYLLKWDFLVMTSVTGFLRRNQVIRTMQWISGSANGHAYPAILILLALVQSNHWRILTACFFAFALELGAYKLIKQSVKRPRPFRQLAGLVNLIVPQDTFSFPSGHTAGAFVVATIIGFCYPRCVVPAYCWASLVGFSRVYLGVHYPTDVVAGACLGILSARIGLLAATQIIPLLIF